MLALFLRRGSTANDGITALTLAAAATAMITVSAVDLFYHISRDIGLHHTARAPPPAHLPPRATQNCLPLPPRDASHRTERRATPASQRASAWASECRRCAPCASRRLTSPHPASPRLAPPQLASCACGFAVVLAAKTCGPGLVPASKEGDASEGRLLRVGLITALTLTGAQPPPPFPADPPSVSV
jgi:hypothetical protein